MSNTISRNVIRKTARPEGEVESGTANTCLLIIAEIEIIADRIWTNIPLGRLQKCGLDRMQN